MAGPSCRWRPRGTTNEFSMETGARIRGAWALTRLTEMIPPEIESIILDKIVRPTIAGLSEEGLPYKGFLYFGLMLTADGPLVLEYNCRMGDPETHPLLVGTDFDLAVR